MEFTITIATKEHESYVTEIVDTIFKAAQHRGTGIAKRTPEYIRGKISEGKAIIAITEEGKFAGFCYIESWQSKKYVANSGLVVAQGFRKKHLARRIKKAAFNLSLEMYPGAKLFGITTSAAVMKINGELGYKAVPFSELTTDEVFWQGCSSCPNHDILQRTDHSMCLCTAMLHDGKGEDPK